MSVKILFCASEPIDLVYLRLGKEVSLIQSALRTTDYRDHFEFEQEWAVTHRDLQELLLRHRPTVFHFSGHGTESSEIILEDESGFSRPVPSQALANLFALLNGTVRCVVLNACYTKKQAQIIAQHVECVLGVSDAITDGASMAFAGAFYRALGYGLSVGAAFELARNQIELEGLDEADLPYLYLDAEDPDQVFLIDTESDSSSAPSSARIPGVDPTAGLAASSIDTLQLVATAPAPPRHYVGRKVLLEALRTELTDKGSVRVIALQGMGGIGKTTTAQRVADMLVPHFSGGVFWADLEDHNGAAEPILRAWSRTCGQDFTSDLGAQILATLMRDQLGAAARQYGPILVVIDDVRLEWIETAEILSEAVPAGCPILITTRSESAAMALDAVIYPVTEMDPAEALAVLEAHVRRTYRGKDQQLAFQILKRVGYLPMAIELAGKRIALDARKPGSGLTRIAEALQERPLEALDIGGHDGLVLTFSATYRKLDRPHQLAFLALGIFKSRRIHLAAVAGTLGKGELEVELLLDDLVYNAFLNWGETGKVYVVHPMLQEYAGYLLEEEERDAQFQDSYVEYYASFVANHAGTEPHHHDALETAIAELPNVAGLAFGKKRFALLSEMVLGLSESSQYFLKRGHYRAAQEILRDAIDACLEMGDVPSAVIHYKNLGQVYFSAGNLEQAQGAYLTAINHLGEKTRETALLVDLRSHLSTAYVSQNRMDDATSLVEQNLVVAEAIEDHCRRNAAMAKAHHDFSNIAIGINDLDGALLHAETSLRLYDEIDHGQGRAYAQYNVGVILARSNKHNELAFDVLKQSLEYWESTGNARDYAMTLIQLSHVARNAGNLGDALAYLEQADEMALSTGAVFTQIAIHMHRGYAYLAVHRKADACSEWQSALVKARTYMPSLEERIQSQLDDECSEH